MNVINLRDKVKYGYNPTVRFTKKIEDSGAYFEQNMKARLVEIQDEHTNMCAFVFDIASFKQYNQALETADYYDENGEPCLTATQSNNAPNKVEDIYFMYEDDVADWFDIVDDDTSVLFNHYKCNPAGKTYTQWLEERVLKLEESVV